MQLPQEKWSYEGKLLEIAWETTKSQSVQPELGRKKLATKGQAYAAQTNTNNATDQPNFGGREFNKEDIDRLRSLLNSLDKLGIQLHGNENHAIYVAIELKSTASKGAQTSHDGGRMALIPCLMNFQGVDNGRPVCIWFVVEISHVSVSDKTNLIPLGPALQCD